MAPDMNRRKFLGTAAASAAAATIVPRHVLGGRGHVPPSDKITLAHIGFGTQSAREIGRLLASPDIQIVAMCDPNKDSMDYVDWLEDYTRATIAELLGKPDWRKGEKGIPGGRDIGKAVVNAYYARERGVEKFRGCSAYADFRELLEKEKDIDAVKIMTPDHLHATIAVTAMKKGKGVVMHKPIANRLSESRLVIDTARTTGVPTHFMPWESNGSMDKVMAWIDNGAIGSLREIHNWTVRPLWPHYPTLPTDQPPIPNGFDWQLWLGPVPDRPYHPRFTHALFRGWYEFGGGPMADMGHYSLWVVFNTLKLGAPISIEATPSHSCAVVDQVSLPIQNDWSFPIANRIKFRFTSLDLFWYDGGMKPPNPEELESEGRALPMEGMMFVGDKGKILAGFYIESPRLIPESRMKEYMAGRYALSGNPSDPMAAIMRRKTGPGGAAAGVPRVQAPPPATAETPRMREWIDHFKGGKPGAGSFLNAGPVSDAVNLAMVATRVGEKIVFDSENMKITNSAEADRYLYRDYRKGWELISRPE